MHLRSTCVALIIVGFAIGYDRADAANNQPDTAHPHLTIFHPVSNTAGTQTLAINATLLTQARAERGNFIVPAFPVSPDHSFDLELKRFHVTTEATRVVLGRQSGADIPVSVSFDHITLLRGTVVGSPGSEVFFALSDRLSTGHVIPVPGGPSYQISSKDHQDQTLPPGTISVFRRSSGGGAMPDALLCNATGVGMPEPTEHRSSGIVGSPNTRQIEIAYDVDNEFFDLFGDVNDVSSYVVSLTAAVSNIYLRDVNTRLNMVFLRIWDSEPDPYVQNDPLGFFANLWNTTMTDVDRDVAHLLSARRNLPYGGIAYLNALCSTVGYGVDGYMNGVFPTPSSGASYDVGLVAHELGHNCGTHHTPTYSPPIDLCYPPPTTYQRGTLMSYCSQTTSGGNYAWDHRFHARVQSVMENFIFNRSCIATDCNGNNVDDAVDIAESASADINGNGTPDECEDCNTNGVLDPTDIANNDSDDDNFNGVPDECEPDCNNNNIPDTLDISLGSASDAYGNNIPDSCEPDCDSDGGSDYNQLLADMSLDINRDLVLDSCEDCDNDGTTDATALAGAHNVWIGSYALDVVGQYHADTGVLVVNSTPSLIDAAQDVLTTDDGRVLVSSANDDRIVAFDAVTGNYLSDLVTSGHGGLDYPTGMLIRSTGTLLVSSRNTNSVLEFDLNSGAFVGEFVTPGSGALVAPFGITYGPNGNVFVTSDNNLILEYDGDSGALEGTFVTAGDNGGLVSPRSLLFKSDGNLLVAGYFSNAVHEYDGNTGAYVGVFQNGGTLYGPWGMRVGPNGNIFVTRDYVNPLLRDPCPNCLHVTSTRIYEYDAQTGNSLGSFVLGDDSGLWSPTGFDFVPGWSIDCNRNLLPDSCDIAGNASADLDVNGILDSCEIDCNGNSRLDFLDIVPFGTSLDCNANEIPDDCERDCNANGQADECDITDGTSLDENSDSIPDECVAIAPLHATQPHDIAKNRYISFNPNNPTTAVAISILLPDGRSGWIDAPQLAEWNSLDIAPISLVVSEPVYRTWSEATIHVTGCVIAPDQTYEVRATMEGANFTTPLQVSTVPAPTIGAWADVVSGFDIGSQTWGGPNGFVNFNDIDAGIKKFQATPTAPHVTVIDLHAQWPNYVINFLDIEMMIKGFQNVAYPVPAADCQTIDKCPLGGEAPCLP